MGYLKNKHIFVAGATGCAGMNVLEALIELFPNNNIKASHFTHPNMKIEHPAIEYVYCDLRSLDHCINAMQGCDALIMVAANTGGAGMIEKSPTAYVTDNLVMNAHVLEACYRVGITRVIYVGSASLYQEYDAPIQEDQLDLNIDPYPAYYGYGWVVRFTEKICRYWYDVHGINIIAVRASNIYGPYAKFDPLASNFIPAIIRKAVDRLDPFEVWGDPDVTRDVLYAKDFARAITLLLDDDSIQFDLFNVCSGQQIKVSEVVDNALKAAGHEPREQKYLTDKPTTISYRAFDNSKIKNRLDWQPEFSLSEGIKKTTEWWIENKKTWTK